jgi:hypothetical protein
MFRKLILPRADEFSQNSRAGEDRGGPQFGASAIACCKGGLGARTTSGERHREGIRKTAQPLRVAILFHIG